MSAPEAKYLVWVWSSYESDWGEDSAIMTSSESDPDAIKDDLNVQWEVNLDNEPENAAELGPAQLIDDLSSIGQHYPGIDPPPNHKTGPAYCAKGYYGRLDTIFCWQKA